MFSTMTESRPFQSLYSRKGCRDNNQKPYLFSKKLQDLKYRLSFDFMNFNNVLNDILNLCFFTEYVWLLIIPIYAKFS